MSTNNLSTLSRISEDIKEITGQLNITSTEEISIIQSLFSHPEDKIPYNTALLACGITEDEPSFISFIKILMKQGYLVLRTEYINGKLEYKYIQKCSQFSNIYYTECISEMTNECLISLSHPLPTLKYLNRKSIHIHNSFITATQADELVDIYIKNSMSKNKESYVPLIYKIPIVNNIAFLFTDESLPLIPELLITRLKDIFRNKIVWTAIIKAIDYPDNLTNKLLDGNDMSLWKDFILKIEKNNKFLIHNSIVENQKDFFEYSKILFYLIPAQIESKEKLQVLNHVKDDIYKVVLKSVSQSEEPLSEVEIKNIISTNLRKTELTPNTYSDFITNFLHTHILSDERYDKISEEADVIIKIDNTYVHFNYLQRVLSENYYELEKKFHNFYSNALKAYLTKKLAPKDNMLLNMDDLEMSVHHILKVENPIFHHILKHQVLLFKVINAKQKVSSLDDFNSLSKDEKNAIFFLHSNFQTRPWYQIFNIDLLSLAYKSFEKLSMFRKMMLRFSGRYDFVSNKLESIIRDSQAPPKKEKEKEEEKEEDDDDNNDNQENNESKK